MDRSDITLANWRQRPFSRAAFQAVETLIPVAEIAPAGATPMPVGDPRGMLRRTLRMPDLSMSVAEWLDASHGDLLTVLKDGKPVFDWAAQDRDFARPHIAFSISKSLTALTAGALAAEGRLAFSDPVTRFVPEAAGTAFGDCTLQNLLDMTVSIDFAEAYLDRGGQHDRYRQAMRWNPAPDGVTPPSLADFLLTLQMDAHPHGHLFYYASPVTDLLGLAVERAAGEPLAALMARLLWEPMGLGGPASITTDGVGTSRAAGGVSLTVRDLAAIGEMVRNGGMCAGRRIVPASFIDDTRFGGDGAPWSRSDWTLMFPEGVYRNCWYQTHNETGALCAIGIHGQWLWIDFERGVTIAKFSSQPLPEAEPLTRLNIEALQALSAALA